MIVKIDEGKARQFKGINFEVLATGKKLMLTKMKYNKGDFVPFHKHPNEQGGYVISGKFRLKFNKFDEILEEGDTYSIPADCLHSIDALENGIVIDSFSPIRKDYL